MPYPSMLTKNLKWSYLCNQSSVETSQRTDLITFRDRQTVLDCGAFDRYATIWPMIEKWSGSSSLVHHKTKNKCPISAHADAPCTTRVEGQVCQVWACPDDPGRFYGRGKTGQNTDSLKIEYPKNSLFSRQVSPSPSRGLVNTWWS